jgi:hypothetical protein
MTIRHGAAALATVTLLAACVQGNVVQESRGALEASPTWSTDNGGSEGVRVTAALAPDGPTQTTASVRVTGAPSGATYAWQIHYGSCDADLGVIGQMDAYPALTTNESGAGSARATLPFTSPTRKSGSFFVKVHDPGDLSKTVACSLLVPRGVRASSY